MDPRLVLILGALFTIVFVAVDARDAGFRSSWWRDRRRAKRNAAFLIANGLTLAALNAGNQLIDAHVPRLVSWPASGPGHVLEVVLCLVVAELVNWLSHWLKHRHPWLWRFHLQHHVETRYNVNLTLHTHGVEVLVTGCLMAALLFLCGFGRFAVDVFTLSYYGANLYKHCSGRFSLGPLDAIIVSPAYHRLHHAKGHDGNFGSVLTLFDVLFGTARFPAMDEAFALPLGVTSPEPFGFISEMLAPLAPLVRIRPALPDVASAEPDR